MFRSKKCSHQTLRSANHDRNMFILIMIETTSRGSFNHDQMKHVKNGGHAERRRVPKRSKIGPTMRPNVYLKYGRCSDKTATIIGDGLKAENLGEHRHET